MKQLHIVVIGTLLSIPHIYAELFGSLAQCKDPAYRRDIYPFDQSFIIDLMKQTSTMTEPRTYIRGVLKLFINIAKGAHYIDSESFNAVLRCFNELLPPYFKTTTYQTYFKHQAVHQLDMLERLKHMNATLLLHELSVNYMQFRSDPTAFIDGLAEQLAAISQEEMEIARLRFTLITFLEVHLHKLIWSPDDQVETWELTKSIADQCAMLVQKDILDDLNDLDDVYWTLIHRYGHFLDLTHTLLDDELFTTVKREITQGNLLMFELEEQDSCMEKRADCLLDAVMFAEAKKQAFEKGLIGR
jgi:hypothetical protein